jgi:hypothetical protein
VSTVALALGTAAPVFLTKGRLRQQQQGPWLAYTETSADVGEGAPAPGTPAVLTFTSSTGVVSTWSGAVRRATVNPGNSVMALQIVGGAGKLLTPLPALDHVYGGSTVPAGVVARAICDDAGEVLAPGVEAALDGAQQLPRWHRAQDVTAARSLDLLSSYLAAATGAPFPWRVNPAGEVTLAPETWPVVTGIAYWQDIDGDDGAVMYAPDGAPLLVGQIVQADASDPGIQAIDVLYTWDADSVSCTIRGAVAGDPVPHGPDLYALSWPATVRAQNEDGTIDVSCDDPRMGDLRSVQMFVGTPGMKVTLDLTVTTRCIVRFGGASPAAAFTESFSQDGTASAQVALTSDTAGFLYAVQNLSTGDVLALLWSPTQAPNAQWQAVPLGGTPSNLGPPGLPLTIQPGSVQVQLR